ncbi:MAG: aldo/keto reductase [Bacteroidia bacterium]|nr:aldo/keto reductase [Bacteroidia bacterium]
MKYNFLGNTGVLVSELCFGTMSFGGITNEKDSREIFDTCREAGINFFDCADVYVGGKSEEILGRFIADCRDEVVITSKAYFRTGKDVNAMGASRYHLVRAMEASLKRLNTDYIDLYFIHRFDERTPIEETLRVLDDMVSQGKILYIGASNFAAWQVAKALGISEKQGWAKFACIQPMYNMVKRQAEVEILPLAISENIGVISYSPLGGGLLSGKYGKAKKPEGGRLIENKMYQIRYGDDWLYEVADQFRELANDVDIHPVSLAIAWVGAHPGITAPIVGARNMDQLGPVLEAANVDMTKELWSRISALSYEPPPATDRNEEGSEHNYGLR